MTTLTFRNTVLETVSHNSQVWFTSAELAKALEYAGSKSVTDIYNKNSEEFTACMSLVVESTTSGNINGLQYKRTRIFSLRGAHLIAMFARTPVAKEFRKWVLDILDKKAGNPVHQPKIPDYRYLVKVIIRDDLLDDEISFAGKANSFNEIATGIATRLGYEPVSFIEIPDTLRKLTASSSR